MNKQNTLSYFLKNITNVRKELIEISKKHNFPIEKIDFEITSFSTYIQNKTTNSEPIKIDDVSVIFDNSIFVSKDIVIYQMYDLHIDNDKDTEFNPFPNFKFKLAFKNKEKTQLYIVIEAGSYIEFTENFYDKFIQFLYKKMLKNGLMIGLFDSKLMNFAKSLSSTIRVHNVVHFEEQEKQLIVESMEFKESVNDKLLLHYKNKNTNISSDRHFISSVLPGEIIFEYIKPFKGSSGRDCFGQYIESAEPLVKYANNYTIDESTISSEDTENNIIYKALTNGYVILKDKKFSITKESTVKRLNFKETGSVDTHIEADIVLNVTENDCFDDAIGAGSYIKVSELKTEGFVGQKAQIEAKNVELNGSIHKTAIIRCDSANIRMLKGTLYCNGVANIELIESGIVYADKVYIKKCLGGKIFANEVYVSDLGSMNTITASKIVEIEQNSSEDNKIIIDTDIAYEIKNKLLSEHIETLEMKQQRLHKLDRKILQTQTEIHSLVTFLKDNNKYISQLVAKINNFKNSKMPVPKSFKDNLKRFQDTKEKISLLNADIVLIKNQIETLSILIELEQQAIFSAYVLAKTRWFGHNQIIFKIKHTEEDLKKIPSTLLKQSKYSVQQEDEKYKLIESANF